MKKFLMFLVLVVVCCSTAQAQRYYIPKYKRERTVVEADMHKQDRKWTITVSSTYNMSLGMQNRIAYRNLDDVVHYNGAVDFHGVTAELGVGRKFGSHVIAGLSTGFDFTNSLKAIPVHGTFRYYYGKSVAARRHRWFSYMELGPQFYLEEEYKTLGASGVIGGGIRVLVLKAMRLDFQVGYRNTLMRHPINRTGSYARDEKDVNFQQYMHSIVVGFNLTLF
jgi:opacity protein-like surface antigen